MILLPFTFSRKICALVLILLAQMIMAQLSVSCRASGGSNHPSDDALPNIVLIFADDLGINDLGCYGRRDHNTPNLDRLASEGMRYTSAYCGLSICSASRAALLTSKTPARLHLTTFLSGRSDADSQLVLHPRIQGFLPLEETTMAEVLQRAGYRTGHFGKWHLGGGGPTKQGFDVAVEPNGNGKLNDLEGGKNEFAIVNAAIDFLKSNNDKPKFCYVPHHSPHVAHAAPKDLIEWMEHDWIEKETNRIAEAKIKHLLSVAGVS
jgi:arylsulfatase A-like enzyme